MILCISLLWNLLEADSLIIRPAALATTGKPCRFSSLIIRTFYINAHNQFLNCV